MKRLFFVFFCDVVADRTKTSHYLFIYGTKIHLLVCLLALCGVYPQSWLLIEVPCWHLLKESWRSFLLCVEGLDISAIPSGREHWQMCMRAIMEMHNTSQERRFDPLMPSMSLSHCFPSVSFCAERSRWMSRMLVCFLIWSHMLVLVDEILTIRLTLSAPVRDVCTYICTAETCQVFSYRELW